ncbi:MAG: AraC family transcriptional regulator [Gammaproteobacteria bacterium]|nr:AraC family transcriptional regulator [Gammaproteobacteria bacterium]
MAPRHASPSGGFDVYRGIYLKRIPTYSFPLMLSIAEELGIGRDTILDNTSLSLAKLEQDGTLISFLQALKFLRRLLKLSPRPDIGLLIGSRYQISTYGMLGYAMMSCPTWLDALQLAGNYHRAASSLVHIEVSPSASPETLALLAKPFYPDLRDIEPFTVEKVFASLVAVSRPLLPRPALPRSVSFAYPQPAYAAEYETTFGCPVQFDAPENRFEWDLELLSQPLLLANKVSAEMGRKLCQDFMSQHQVENSWSRKVSDILMGAPGRLPDMEQVASQLHLSSRTLRRNLRLENITFQTLSDTLRHDMSKRYLQNSRLNLDEIAHLVGFTETTNFRRAFRRWEGQPPAKYRRRMQAQVLS